MAQRKKVPPSIKASVLKVLQMSAPNAIIGFAKQHRRSSFSSKRNFNRAQKHQERDLIPLVPTSMWSSVLISALFRAKKENKSVSSTQTPKASTSSPGGWDDGLQTKMALVWHCSVCFQTSGQHTSSAAHLWPLPLLLAPLELAQGKSNATVKRGAVGQCPGSSRFPHLPVVSWGLVETSSQQNLFFCLEVSGNLTLLSSQVTECFLSPLFCLCLFKQEVLQRLPCAFFVGFPAHLAVLDKVPRPDCNKK